MTKRKRTDKTNGSEKIGENAFIKYNRLFILEAFLLQSDFLYFALF